MKRKIFFIAYITIFFVYSIYAQQQQAFAKLTFIMGNVKIVKVNGVSRPGKAGLRLRTGDRIETAAKSRAEVRLPDGTAIRIGQNSKFTITKLGVKDADSNFSLGVGKVWAKVANYLSITSHYNNFAMGVVDSRDVIFYLTFTFIGLFLTYQSIASLRWR